jgi:hypothetical protein
MWRPLPAGRTRSFVRQLALIRATSAQEAVVSSVYHQRGMAETMQKYGPGMATSGADEGEYSTAKKADVDLKSTSAVFSHCLAQCDDAVRKETLTPRGECPMSSL